MGSVEFTYLHERDTDEVLELEIEATVVRGFQGMKLVSVDAIAKDGELLSRTEIEDLVEEIGEEELEAKAGSVGADEDEIDEDSVPLMDEMDVE